MKWIIGLLIAAAIAAGAFFYFKKKGATAPAGTGSAPADNAGGGVSLFPLNPAITLNGKTAAYKSVSDTGVEYYDKDQNKLNLNLGEKLAFSTQEKKNKIS